MMLQNSGNSGMALIRVVILVFSVFALCNGCTYIEPRRAQGGAKPDGCMDGDIKRDLGTTWVTEDCTECVCTSEGLISCCTVVFKDILLDAACEAVLNKTSCKYEVKRKDDSTEPCHKWAVM